MLQKNAIVELEIDAYATNGQGISHNLAIPVFVDGVVIGDKILVKIYDIRKSFALGKVVEILNQSPDRVKPFCQHFSICGGCQWQHLDYQAQLKAKQDIVRNCLIHIGGFKDLLVETVIPAIENKAYRNKAQFPISFQNNKIEIGFYKIKSHDLINISACPVASVSINKLLENCHILLNKHKLRIYDEISQIGLLRHLIMQYSFGHETILVTLVLNTKDKSSIDSKENHKLNLFMADLRQSNQNISGICLNFNDKPGNKILGQTFCNGVGNDYIIESLSSQFVKWPNNSNILKLKIKSQSFFQINPRICEKLNDEIYKVVACLNSNNKLNIIDAYGGIGTIALWLAPLANKIICLEISHQAIECGKDNAELNGITNINFSQGLVEDNLAGFLLNDNYDLIILDPPRKGVDKNVLELIKKLFIKNIIYISCNPATLARDLKILTSSYQNFAYKINLIQPLDMFSHTFHIETMVSLTLFPEP